MGMYAVDAADSGDLSELGSAAREGRAAAVSRRRQLSQGKEALNGDGDGTADVNGAGAPAAASNGQGAPSGAQGDQGDTAVATDGVADAHLGRALSVQRRRQMSRGKQALNGGGDRTAAAAGAGVPTFIVHRGGGR